MSDLKSWVISKSRKHAELTGEWGAAVRRLLVSHMMVEESQGQPLMKTEYGVRSQRVREQGNEKTSRKEVVDTESCVVGLCIFVII